MPEMVLSEPIAQLPQRVVTPARDRSVCAQRACVLIAADKADRQGGTSSVGSGRPTLTMSARTTGVGHARRSGIMVMVPRSPVAPGGRFSSTSTEGACRTGLTKRCARCVTIPLPCGTQRTTRIWLASGLIVVGGVGADGAQGAASVSDCSRLHRDKLAGQTSRQGPTGSCFGPRCTEFAGR